MNEIVSPSLGVCSPVVLETIDILPPVLEGDEVTIEGETSEGNIQEKLETKKNEKAEGGEGDPKKIKKIKFEERSTNLGSRESQISSKIISTETY